MNLDETELLLRNKFPDIDCACSGFDDEMHVFIADENETVGERVRNFLADKLSFNTNAFKIMYIKVIPRNNTGKILYNQLV